MCPHSPESQPYFGLHPKKRGQQGKGGDLAPVVGRSHLEYCIQMWSPQYRRDIDLLDRRATEMIYRIEYLSYEDRLRARVVQPGEEKAVK